MGHLYYESKNFAGGAFEKKLIKSVYFGAELLWPHLPPVLSVDPLELEFKGTGDSLNVQVVIANKPTAEYTINVPSWLAVSNKTQTGFTLTASDNLTGAVLSGEVIVSLDDFPEQTQTIQVSQLIEPLTILYTNMNSDPNASQYSNGFIVKLTDIDGRVDWGNGVVSYAKDVVSVIDQDGVETWQVFYKYPTNANFTVTIYNVANIPRDFVGSYNNYIIGAEFAGSINSIGDNAFTWAQNCEKIDLTSLIKSIGNNSFYNNFKLQGDIKLTNLESLGNAAFTHTAITSFEISGNSTIDTLPTGTLDTCGYLTSVILGKNIEHIGNIALQNVGNNLDNQNLTTNLEILGKIKSIGDSAFYNSHIIGNFVFDYLESVGVNVFNVSNIGDLDFTNSSFDAFDGTLARNTLTVKFPATLKLIQADFAGYQIVTDVWFNSLTPPSLIGSFTLPIYHNITIHVPNSALAGYQSDPNWNGTNQPRFILQGF